MKLNEVESALNVVKEGIELFLKSDSLYEGIPHLIRAKNNMISACVELEEMFAGHLEVRNMKKLEVNDVD